MTPAPSSDNLSYGLLADAKCAGQRTLVGVPGAGPVAGAYFNDLRLRQLDASPVAFASCDGLGMGSATASFPRRSDVSALLVAVVAVVGACAKKVMVGVTARGMVATMKDAQAVGDRPLADSVSDPMRQVLILRNSPSAINHEPSIAVIITLGGPQPTVIGASTVNVGPESGNLLFSQQRDATIRFSHGSLLDRGLLVRAA